METVEINKDKLVKQFKSSTPTEKKLLVKLYGKKMFETPKPTKKENLNLMDKLKTLDDVLKYNKTTLAKILPYKKPKNLRERKLNHEAVWFLIVETFNEGWIEDFSDSGQNKYVPYGFYNSEYNSFSYNYYNSWHTGSSVGFGWGFKSPELAEYCAKQFNGEWNNMLLAK